MVTSQSFQIAGILSARLLTSSPWDISRTLMSPCDPFIAKLIFAAYPDPLTPPRPGRLKATMILSALFKPHITGISVLPILPTPTSSTVTTSESNQSSNCPLSRSVTFSMSIVALNVSVTTGGALTVTGTPMVTQSSIQTAGISSASVSASSPPAISRTHASPCNPVTSKLIVAICPEPLAPATPGRLKSTRIVPASMKSHDSTGTCLPLMSPS